MIQMKFVNKEPINKGWSCDRKYCAVTADGTKYLLRITPKEKSASRADMFRIWFGSRTHFEHNSFDACTCDAGGLGKPLQSEDGPQNPEIYGVSDPL